VGDVWASERTEMTTTKLTPLNSLLSVDWGEIDYLVVDTPPGTSDEHISIVQYLKEFDATRAESTSTNSTSAVLVTTPEEVSVADVRRQVTFCKKVSLEGE